MEGVECSESKDCIGGHCNLYGDKLCKSCEAWYREAAQYLGKTYPQTPTEWALWPKWQNSDEVRGYLDYHLVPHCKIGYNQVTKNQWRGYTRTPYPSNPDVECFSEPGRFNRFANTPPRRCAFTTPLFALLTRTLLRTETTKHASYNFAAPARALLTA